MTLSSQEEHFFTLFMLSRAFDNTTSQNIGGTNAWVVPHLEFWGTVSPVPLGLRPCSQQHPLVHNIVCNSCQYFIYVCDLSPL